MASESDSGGHAVTVSAIARAQLDRWLASGLAADAAEINRGTARGGCCVDFACDLVAALADAGIDAEDLSVCQFLEADEDGEREATPFDKDLFLRHWPRTLLPEGTTWDDWDELSRAANFSHGTHVFAWTPATGRFYDSECVDGAAHFLDLPFFARALASWRAEAEAGPSP